MLMLDNLKLFNILIVISNPPVLGERSWSATLCRGRMSLSNGRAEARPSKALFFQNDTMATLL
jgi:hypothetical protein